MRDPGSKGDSHVRKEVYATIDSPEFSIRTKPKSGQLNTELAQGETWGGILRAQSSNENMSGFSKFDPLRTIHFLGKELKSQLKDAVPYNSTILDVICEMESALKRIPHDIQLIADTAVKKQEGRQSRQSHKEKIKTKSEACQTPSMWYLEPVRLQQHLEESSEKIEKACQQMEILCSKLKTEKENVEVQLKIEQESTKVLKHQVEEYKVKLQGVSSLAESLKSQNSTLKADVERQRLQLASVTNETPAMGELKLFIQDLERAKADTDSENARLQREVRLAQIENEKYEAILQARDTQVKEIRYEMTQLQEVVHEQLLDFQNVSTSDEATVSHSLTNIQEEVNSGTFVSPNNEPIKKLFNNRRGRNQYDDGDAHSAGATSPDHLAEMQDLHLDVDSFKLRHVYKIPIPGVAQTSKCLDLPTKNPANIKRQTIENAGL